jgi:hypothetical protein
LLLRGSIPQNPHAPPTDRCPSTARGTLCDCVLHYRKHLLSHHHVSQTLECVLHLASPVCSLGHLGSCDQYVGELFLGNLGWGVLSFFSVFGIRKSGINAGRDTDVRGRDPTAQRSRSTASFRSVESLRERLRWACLLLARELEAGERRGALLRNLRGADFQRAQSSCMDKKCVVPERFRPTRRATRMRLDYPLALHREKIVAARNVGGCRDSSANWGKQRHNAAQQQIHYAVSGDCPPPVLFGSP